MSGNPMGFATEATARQVLAALAAISVGDRVPEGDEDVLVERFTRPDGTTSRVVETITAGGATRTVTTRYSEPQADPELGA